jgi:hypothetical protein
VRVLPGLEGQRDPPVHADQRRPRLGRRADADGDRVCADGYWTDLTKSLCPGELTPRDDSLLDGLLGVFDTVIASSDVNVSELDLTIRSALAGRPRGQPPRPVAHGVRARAHEPPWPHRAGSGTIEEGMVLALEAAVYWPEVRRTARRGQLPLHPRRRAAARHRPRRLR